LLHQHETESRWLYEEVYGQRGDLENRIKELHYGMEIGRTSCTSFWAIIRVLMTAAAYVLMQELRLVWLARVRGAQVSILRQRFLKLGVQWLPRHVAWCCICRKHSLSRSLFIVLALSLGAQPGKFPPAPT